MNLWNIFPELLLKIEGILYLPYVAIAFYLYVLYALFKYSDQRISLIVFVLLTLIASGIMFNSMGPGFGKIIPPLALLIVMAMPLLMSMVKLYQKSYVAARIWGLVTLAGWTHSVSWSVWLFAMARS